MSRHSYTPSGKVQFWYPHSFLWPSRDTTLSEPSQEKSRFLSFFEDGRRNSCHSGSSTGSSCVKHFVALVLHAALSISDLMLYHQEVYLVHSIPFVQQLGPFPTRSHDVYSWYKSGAFYLMSLCSTAHNRVSWSQEFLSFLDFFFVHSPSSLVLVQHRLSNRYFPYVY